MKKEPFLKNQYCSTFLFFFIQVEKEKIVQIAPGTMDSNISIGASGKISFRWPAQTQDFLMKPLIEISNFHHADFKVALFSDYGSGTWLWNCKEVTEIFGIRKNWWFSVTQKCFYWTDFFIFHFLVHWHTSSPKKKIWIMLSLRRRLFSPFRNI